MKRSPAFAVLLLAATPATAQNRISADARTAYGPRLTGAAAQTDLNAHRVNNRIANRVGNRLNLRIERFDPGDAADTTAALRTPQSDNSRMGAGALTAPTRLPPPTNADQAGLPTYGDPAPAERRP